MTDNLSYLVPVIHPNKLLLKGNQKAGEKKIYSLTEVKFGGNKE